MKYNEKNQPLVCMMTQSTCYRGTSAMTVKGILWHSTGTNNTSLSRYVQPDDNAANKDYLLSILGKNKYNNDWNHIERQAGLNAWIGKAANGEVMAVQTMPWNYRPWGCGSGAKGSCNYGFIQFEICEDSLTDKNYFSAVYKEAVELTAYLCKLYNLSPFGTTTVNGITVPVILCHKDSAELGLGSNHVDIYHWFGRFGKSMEDVRRDVASLLAAQDQSQPLPLDEERIREIIKEELALDRESRLTNKCGSWSKTAREWAIENQLISGIGDGVFAWPDYLTREQAAALFYRLYNIIIKDV